MLRVLGEKVQKMEKLAPGEFLQDVHAAAEDLQLKIDEKSYLLVNAESWESVKRPGKFKDPEHLQDLKDNESKPLVINSLSAINLKSTYSFKNYDLQNPNMSTNLSVSQWGSGEDMLKHQTLWPSRLSLIGDTILNEREVRTYESAIALSLSTFTTLLIEFVARLQNLVESFEVLSEKAKFKDPIISTETKVEPGCWDSFLKRICCKD